MSTSRSGPPVSQEYLNEYGGNTLIAICALFMILETVLVVLRYYARHLTTSGFGWDDALIPAAWLTNVGLCILCITTVFDAGVGRHLAAVLKYHPTELESWAKSLYALEWLYLTSVALPKISVLCLYLRIFTSRGARLTCYVLLGITTLTWVAYIIAANFQCTPFEFQWDKKIPGGHCFDIEAYYKSTSVPNIVTDLIILILPVPTVVNLKVTMTRKLGLLLVFLVGSVGLIGSCARMSTFFHNDAFTDNTWASVLLMGWSIIEPGMYLIAACLLALRPILRKMSPKELKTRLRIPSISRAPDNAKSDDSQGLRHKAEPPGKSSSDGIELQGRQDKRSAHEETTLPPRSIDVDLSLRHYDVEHGFTSLARYVPSTGK